MVDTTTRQDEQAVLDPQVEKTAEQAVRILDIGDAIQAMSELLFQQIEDCEIVAETAPPAEQDPTFLALTLPLANNLIHYAAAVWDMEAARQWVHNHWPQGLPAKDPIATLAALTLIHLVNKGSEHFREDAARKDVWARIGQRIVKLI
ncbi:MAG TPA: hypothetical protein VJ276_22770 [Thermoanaerobaculia bacterium]|nr:hypothetical protein [Thermoanaerobaculia bacterium]